MANAATIRFLAVFVAAILLALAGGMRPAVADQARTALVIGNGAYSFAPLANPDNDASDVARALRDAGFDVTLITDADPDGMRAAVGKFGAKLRARGGVGLFYFAGHGAQVDGENYLLPIVDGISGVSDLTSKALDATKVVDVMAAAKNDLNIVILDACRNNPLTGDTRGLSRIDSNAHLFISYSTSPGSVALDGRGRNSPYSKYLVRSIETPNLNLEETFKRTLKGVYQETNGQQTPWLSSSFFGDFVFRQSGQAGTATGDGNEAERSDQLALSRLPNTAGTAAVPDLTGVYRVDGRNPNGSRYKGMVALTQNGDRFDLTWWIGKDIFHGTGQLAGRMLVVNWGAKHPVIYSFAGHGVLDGEWADGSASESLKPAALARAGARPRPGRYRVDGRNPNGSRYKGRLDLTANGDRYALHWKIGQDSYRGTGRVENGLLVVDWGGTTPVIYAPTQDGRLVGLWQGGLGSETLIPGG